MVERRARAIFSGCLLAALMITGLGEAAPADTAAADPTKRIAELERRLGELEQSQKTSEIAALRAIEAQLTLILGRIPAPESWGAWAGRFEGLASNTRSTRGWTLVILVVAVAVAVGVAVKTSADRQEMLRMHERMRQTVAEVTRALAASQSAPVIAVLQPPKGPIGGGMAVVVRGRNFVQGAVVRFGTTIAPASNVVSPELIETVTPAGAPGPVDVSVQNPDGARDTLRVAYTYAPPPVIHAVFPDKSPAAGTTLTVVGANFQPDATVQLGGASVKTTVESENHVTCRLGPGPTGLAVAVSVTNGDEQSASWAGRVTYV